MSRLLNTPEMEKRWYQKLEMEDFKGVLLLLIAFIPSLFIRCKYKKIWLFLERKHVADDNAWMLYHWTRSNHPEIAAFFLLNESACNFERNNNHFIAWGSLRHYIYYLACDIRVCATFDKARPSVRVCSYLEQYLKKGIKTIYVRHGIHKDGPEMHLFSLHHFRLFVCGAKPEYDYLKETAGYPTENIKYLGFARFDDLLLNKKDGRFILLIPTWRRYMGAVSRKNEAENLKDFIESDFYLRFQSLLNNKILCNFLEESGLKLRFCLHSYYKRYENLFHSDCPNVEIVNSSESIHKLLMENELLITDYSSVFFDAAYAEKPVVYYHFDYEEFRKRHFSEGYFDYERDGLGPVINDEEKLVNTIISMYDGNRFVNPKMYLERARCNFPLHDSNNCQRIFDEILKITQHG